MQRLYLARGETDADPFRSGRNHDDSASKLQRGLIAGAGSRPGGRPEAGMTPRRLSTETTNTFKARELWIYLPAVTALLLVSYPSRAAAPTATTCAPIRHDCHLDHQLSRQSRGLAK